MGSSELERFFAAWAREADRTIRLLEALPADSYDLRPEPGGRSTGELAWHLAEVDAYMSAAIEAGGFRKDLRPPNLARPRTIAELAPGYRRVYDDSAARLRGMGAIDLDRAVPVFVVAIPIREILWDLIIGHAIHHRGQLSVLCRMAGGEPPDLYGPTRERIAAVHAALP